MVEKWVHKTTGKHRKLSPKGNQSYQICNNSMSKNRCPKCRVEKHRTPRAGTHWGGKPHQCPGVPWANILIDIYVYTCRSLVLGLKKNSTKYYTKCCCYRRGIPPRPSVTPRHPIPISASSENCRRDLPSRFTYSRPSLHEGTHIPKLQSLQKSNNYKIWIM